MLAKRKNMKKIILAGLMVGLTVVGSVGCDTLQPGSEDANLSRAVMERLNNDSLLQRQALGVSAENGVVTLRGTVTDETIRMRAKSLAESTPGVVKVQDQMIRR
jgi:osmotically-inducible protein OsmY